MRQLRDEGGNVCGFHNLEKLVRSIVFEATDGCRGVEEGDALLPTMPDNLIEFEAFLLLINEVILVAKEDLSLDAPVVVYPIRVKEVHAPPLSLRRKTAQEEDFRILRQERFQGMILDVALASFYVFCVQIGHRKAKVQRN